MFTKGQQLANFEVLESIGSGGFGTVYLVEDLSSGIKRAMKVLHENISEESEEFRESKVQSKLKHKNIIQYITANTKEIEEEGEKEEITYLVMEYVEGPTLKKILKDRETLDVSEAADYLKQICDAVSYAHKKNVIHRDIRPANIIYSEEEDLLKVGDFGTSKILMTGQLAETKIGSPPYMAPEQFDGKAQFQSDIYSIGVMAYKMITGKLPYYDINPSRIEAKVKKGQATAPNLVETSVPKEVSDVVMKAISKDVSERYSRASDFIRNLEKALDRSVRSTEMDDIRTRLEARQSDTSTRCWNCNKPLSRRTKSCPHCGEEQ